jgi:hypothetical protein
LYFFIRSGSINKTTVVAVLGTNHKYRDIFGRNIQGKFKADEIMMMPMVVVHSSNNSKQQSINRMDGSRLNEFLAVNY